MLAHCIQTMGKKPLSIQASFDFNTPQIIEEDVIPTPQPGQLSWITVAKNSSYFTTDSGESWTPIGQNDAITWPELSGAFRRRDLPAVESYLNMLTQHGVTCLRLMLEYCQGENRYLEKPAGYFQPNMIKLWDDIFALCGKYSLRILLTPYDTFWMWRRWSHHPYNHSNNGPCNKRSQWLLCPDTRKAIKKRLYFATQRWGGNGTLFAWDLWNEIRPAHSGNSAKGFAAFIEDVGNYLHNTEMELHGRAHPQTVSVFSPVLQKDHRIASTVFYHRSLDFATIHLYEHNSIDNPKNTIDAAISTGRLTRQVIREIKDNRPFLDSEHGPIKTFNVHGKTLPTDFDDEYFRHMQWAHFASGGAGGGMRWPYRNPHTLTAGMRNAQLALSRFLPLISWSQFNRINLNNEIKLSDNGLTAFGCGDEKQAIVWLLRTNAIGKNKMINPAAMAKPFTITIPLLVNGNYDITFWDTISGTEIKKINYNNDSIFELCLPAVKTDLAIAIRYL